jgi:Fe-S cluster assembly ATP-binding protein
MELVIKDLRANIGDKEILKGVNLTVKPGTIHAIMGPNGSGKSTLSNTIMGHPSYTVTGGEVWYKGHNILELDVDDRAKLGLFLAFQYPVSIPGVTVANFMRAAVNAHRAEEGKDTRQTAIPMAQFRKEIREKMAALGIDEAFARRYLNEGFSGGEKKRNEIFQMAMLEPSLSILDETDSGLDIDALRIVSQGVNALRSPNNATIVITHYQRLLEYIVPDVVHVLAKGRIVMSGGKELALELESRGYDWVKAEETAA